MQTREQLKVIVIRNRAALEGFGDLMRRFMAPVPNLVSSFEAIDDPKDLSMTNVAGARLICQLIRN